MKKWLIIAVLAVIAWKNVTFIENEIMAIANSTLNFIIKEEGFKTQPYKDSKGLLTIGVGHLIKENETHLLNANLTKEQVQELLKNDLNQCDATINSLVKVPLNQNQYDALYSLCFNIGSGNFAKSQVVQKLNAKDYKGAADAILNWNKPEILIPRRQRERTLFLRAQI